MRGDLVSAHRAAEVATQRYSRQSPEWEWKFRILDATALNLSGQSQDVLNVLTADLPPSLLNSNEGIRKLVLEGLSFADLHRFPDARQRLNQALQSCGDSSKSALGDVLKGQGLLAMQQADYKRAHQFFLQALNAARQNQDQFLEAWALLDLSYAALQAEHFEEAMEWANSATQAAGAIGARMVNESALGNRGWAEYKTGDVENAQEAFRDAIKSAHELGAVTDEVRWLTASGYVYVDQGKLDTAEDSYRKALDLATKINSKEDILNAQISLAFVSVLTGQLDHARKFSDGAIASARTDGNRIDELYPLFTKGQVAARQGKAPEAEAIFSEVAGDPKVDPSLKWEAQHDLANLYAEQHQTAKAEATYRTTLTTFEAARSAIKHEDVKLPFLANATSLYEDYVTFLLSERKTAEALRVADHARARTLAEGLGQLPKIRIRAPESS